MHPLHFANQFFNLVPDKWQTFWRQYEGDSNWRKILFESELFSRRILRVGEIINVNQAEKIYADMIAIENALGIRSISYDSPDFPVAINNYIPPERRPLILYIRGGQFPNENDAIAVVGTRRPSELGEESAK